MLKGQVGCVKLLLEQPDIDVNGKDENGRTLVSQSIEMLSEEALTQLKYLLTEKQADPNISDSQGFTALHLLCTKPRPVYNDHSLFAEDKQKLEEDAWDWQIKAAEYLIDAGCSIDLRCNNDLTAVMYAMRSQNIKLAEVLINKGADMSITSPTGGGVFHFLVSFNRDFLSFCKILLEKQEIVSSALNILDENGFNTFLKFVHYFSLNSANHRSEIRNKIKYEMTEDLRKNLMNIETTNNLLQETNTFNNFNQNFGMSSYLNADLSSQIDNSELERRTNEDYTASIENFISILRIMIHKGAYFNAVVEKLQKYREDPNLILKEEINDGTKPNYFGPSTKTENFILDFEGNKIYKEYGPDGLQNALHLASRNSEPLMLDFLLSLDIDINQQDFYGNTPLLLFCKNSTFFIEKLLNKGSDPSIFNYEKDSPIQISVENKNN